MLAVLPYAAYTACTGGGIRNMWLALPLTSRRVSAQRADIQATSALVPMLIGLCNASLSGQVPLTLFSGVYLNLEPEYYEQLSPSISRSRWPLLRSPRSGRHSSTMPPFKHLNACFVIPAWKIGGKLSPKACSIQILASWVLKALETSLTCSSALRIKLARLVILTKTW